MESASLTKAHAHARSAFSRKSTANATSAIEEHSQAAGEFAQAAKDTGDAEALRTLRLLEQHHQKLAQIIQIRSSHTTSQQRDSGVSDVEKKDPEAAEGQSPEAKLRPEPAQNQRAPVLRQKSPQPPSLPLPHRGPPRDLSSTIASNLASARGIPSAGQQRRGPPVSPALSTQHAGGKMVNAPDRTRNSTANKPAGVPAVAEDGEEPKEKTERPISAKGQADYPLGAQVDEPFHRFYTTFEGLLSKISAPLAFAGLPLSGEQQGSAPVLEISARDQAAQPEMKVVEPDLNRIFSKASLRALRETHGPSGGLEQGGESFYVVPSSGGTLSYAGILRGPEDVGVRKADGGLANSQGDDDAQFVDARESPQPPSPGVGRKSFRRSSKVSTPAGSNSKTMEELHLENQALRQLSDTLSKRLHMWEINAQSSSIALHQSIRALSHQSPTASEAGKQGADESPDKVKELQDQLRAAARETDRVTKENEKLKGVVGRYREKWEKLKEGARLRREGVGNEAKEAAQLA